MNITREIASKEDTHYQEPAGSGSLKVIDGVSVIDLVLVQIDGVKLTSQQC